MEKELREIIGDLVLQLASCIAQKNQLLKNNDDLKNEIEKLKNDKLLDSN